MHKPKKLVKIQNQTPSVSIIMPVRNEEKYIQKALYSLFAQDYSNILEIIIVDGMSTDKTREVISKTSEEFERERETQQADGLRKIRLLDNKKKLQVPARNLGIKEAKGEVVMFADAHALYEKDYVSQCVKCLVKTGAGNAASIMRIRPKNNLVARAIAALHYSKLGIGVAKFHNSKMRGWVDHGWLGFYWRFILDELGGYREELERSHDIDLDARMRTLGYGVYLCPEAKAYYVPRSNVRGLWRQNFGNGMAVMQSLFVNYKALSLRHLVPFAFVTGLCLLILLAVYGNLWLHLLYVCTGVYSLSILAASIYDSLKNGFKLLPIMPLSYLTLHVCYGMGSWYGLIKLAALKVRGKNLNIFE